MDWAQVAPVLVGQEAEEGAVVNHGQGVAEVQDQRAAGVARKLYVSR